MLTNWVDVKSEWDNPQLEEDFAKILKTREVVTRAIEPLRADKKLEVLWKLQFVKSEYAELLKQNAKDLADIFITSQAYVAESAPKDVLNEYTEDGITVWVTASEGENANAAGNTENSVKLPDMKQFVQIVQRL